MTRHARDVWFVVIACAAIVAAGWLAILEFHPNSTFVLDLKVWFHIP